MLEIDLNSIRLRIGLTNMLALPLALSYSRQLLGDEEPGTEFAVFIGPIIISFSWGF